MQKTCKICGTVFEYENPDELKEHFYFKAGYYMNNCKKCELEKHKKKYANGKYNYRKNIDAGYDLKYSIGNLSRCSYISNYDNYPFFNFKRKIK